jgi:indolepyruvate ferredoxin oxidoreductase beta subunit
VGRRGGEERIDVVLAGVGGQGVLILSHILARAGLRYGWTVKQGEVHGMSQRGGAVQAHLRMAEREVAAPLIPRGTAHLIVATEPLEALRAAEYLAPDGQVVTSVARIDEVEGYPDEATLEARLAELPGLVTVDGPGLAREAGSARAANVVVLGAALDLLPLPAELVEDEVGGTFADRGARLVEVNRRALEAGRQAAGAGPRPGPGP